MTPPLLYHWLPELAEEVKVTEFPSHTVVAPEGLIVGVGGVVFIVTSIALEKADVQVPLLICVVKLPVIVAVYVCDVAPVIATPFLYHWFPEAIDELRMTLPPVQKEVAPPAVITGVVVEFVIVMVMALEAAE